MLPEPLAQRDSIFQLGGVPDVGGQVVDAKTVVVRLGPLLHLGNFDDADIAEMAGGCLVETIDDRLTLGTF